jgi:tRNA threonylcarbamoyladenosine biosynthesis protein TsaE
MKLTGIFITSTTEETEALGERLGESLQKGDVAALAGTLGAGKTCFARGVARAWGVGERVTSPTYTIINEYDGRLPFFHIDAYRLSGRDDFATVCGGEVFDDGICVAEWPENIAGVLPEDTVWVDINIRSDGSREIVIRR